MSSYDTLINHKGWICAKCGKHLPTGSLHGRYGLAWRFRYNQYLKKIKQGGANVSGCYCDSCCEERESMLGH